MKHFFGFGTKEKQSGADSTNSNLNNNIEQICGLSQLYSPEQEIVAHVRDVADILHEMEVIGDQQLSELRRAQEKNANCDVCQVIADHNFADEQQIAQAKANLYGFEFIRPEPEKIDREIFEKLEPEYIKSNRIMPVALKGQILVVATSRPSELFIIEDVKRQTRMNVEVVVCLE
jgi:hypothetical protein